MRIKQAVGGALVFAGLMVLPLSVNGGSIEVATCAATGDGWNCCPEIDSICKFGSPKFPGSQDDAYLVYGKCSGEEPGT